MQKKTLAFAAVATSAMLIGGSVASADVLAQYDFEEFTTTVDAWPAADGPYANAVSVSGVTTSGLNNEGLGALEALAVRDASFGELDSYALLIGPGNISGDALSADVDYLGFTVTAGAPLDFTTFNFDLGVSNTSDSTDLDHAASAQVYYSVDGGATFTAIGAEQNRSTGPGPDDVFTGMITSTVDLSSLALAEGETAEFRLAIRNNRGYGTTTGGVYVDNVTLEGAVVPEPATAGLLGLAGLGLLARRRRA